jgi:hypothetical protein
VTGYWAKDEGLDQGRAALGNVNWQTTRRGRQARGASEQHEARERASRGKSEQHEAITTSTRRERPVRDESDQHEAEYGVEARGSD